MKKLILAVLIFSSLSAQAGEETLTDLLAQEGARPFSIEEYMHHREVVLQILKACPPSECVYLGLGRSPTVYMAMLENLAPGAVRNLPLSLSGVSTSADGTVVLSANGQTDLDAHLKKFLPGRDSLNGKRVMMVDFVNTGKGVLSARKLVKEHYRKAGSATAVDIFAFGRDDVVEGVVESVKKDGGRATGFVDNGGGYGGRSGQWQMESWDTSSQYDSYKPGGTVPSNSLKARGAYYELQNATKRYLDLDPAPELARYRKAGARAPAASGGGGCKFGDITAKFGAAIRNLSYSD